MSFFRDNTNFFPNKLPAVRYIAFRAHMGFIPVVEQVNQVLLSESFQSSQPFYLIGIVFRMWLALAAFPYALVSSAKAFKKRRSVELLTRLPLAFSHSALAVCKRCRLAFTLLKMAASSLNRSIIGLRPRPGLVISPRMPSAWYRPTQLLTLIWHIFTMPATSLDLRPSALSRITWQRVRNAWLLPVLRPVSSSCRAFASSVGVLTRPIGTLYYKII